MRLAQTHLATPTLAGSWRFLLSPSVGVRRVAAYPGTQGAQRNHAFPDFNPAPRQILRQHWHLGKYQLTKSLRQVAHLVHDLAALALFLAVLGLCDDLTKQHDALGHQNTATSRHTDGREGMVACICVSTPPQSHPSLSRPATA
jgi:hypothetical protein